MTDPQSCLAAMGDVAGRTTVTASLYGSTLYCKVARRKPLIDTEVRAAARIGQKGT